MLKIDCRISAYRFRKRKDSRRSILQQNRRVSVRLERQSFRNQLSAAPDQHLLRRAGQRERLMPRAEINRHDGALSALFTREGQTIARRLQPERPAGDKRLAPSQRDEIVNERAPAPGLGGCSHASSQSCSPIRRCYRG